MSKNTKSKYYEFMCVLHDMKEFDIKELRSQHRVSSRLITLLREHNMIKRDGSVTRWVGDKPSQAIALAFAKECLKQSRISNAQSKAGPQQMKLTPIKKVQQTQPAPVQQPDVDLLNCDRTNSKVSITMVVGAILCFLIATIIWK